MTKLAYQSYTCDFLTRQTNKDFFVIIMRLKLEFSKHKKYNNMCKRIRNDA